jgi:hypothetical protein
VEKLKIPPALLSVARLELPATTLIEKGCQLFGLLTVSDLANAADRALERSFWKLSWLLDKKLLDASKVYISLGSVRDKKRLGKKFA